MSTPKVLGTSLLTKKEKQARQRCAAALRWIARQERLDLVQCWIHSACRKWSRHKYQEGPSWRDRQWPSQETQITPTLCHVSSTTQMLPLRQRVPSSKADKRADIPSERNTEGRSTRFFSFLSCGEDMVVGKARRGGPCGRFTSYPKCRGTTSIVQVGLTRRLLRKMLNPDSSTFTALQAQQLHHNVPLAPTCFRYLKKLEATDRSLTFITIGIPTHLMKLIWLKQ